MKIIAIICLLIASPALADDYETYERNDGYQQQQSVEWDRFNERMNVQQQMQDIQRQQQEQQQEIDQQNYREQMQRMGRPVYPNF